MFGTFGQEASPKPSARLLGKETLAFLECKVRIPITGGYINQASDTIHSTILYYTILDWARQYHTMLYEL